MSAPSNVFPVDSRISAYDYLDLDGSMALTEHLNLRLGINNLTNRKPPVVGFTDNPLLVNGNMLAGMYDTLGQFVFINVTAQY